MAQRNLGHRSTAFFYQLFLPINSFSHKLNFSSDKCLQSFKSLRTENLNNKLNCNTQPLKEHKIFNNWNVVTDGWYIVFKSSELKNKQVKSATICGQHLVFFRTESGAIHSMDGFCPHMGVDLGIGKVIGEKLQCFFHHWEFNQTGQCVHIPCQDEIPKKAKNRAYKTIEKLGFIWVNPSIDEEVAFLEIPELKGEELLYQADPFYLRSCHHHITMINGIDPQHLKTVHSINIEMNIEINQLNRNEIEIELNGRFSEDNFKDRLMSFFLGKDYSYSMNYQDGCLAGLSILKGVSLFGKYKVISPLHMYFAYRPIEEGKTLVCPIYVTKKRPGLSGFIVSKFCLSMTKMLFKALQGEDGEVYENIRFNTECLLPIDRPVVTYLAYINRLKSSVWSKNFKDTNE